MLKEFEIIEKIFKRTSSSIFLGIGDDAALFQKNKKEFWVISQDTLNIDTHFLSNTDPENLGWKSLAVNVSDILSMGGNPRYALLSMSVPSANQVWIKKFSNGFFKCAKNYGVELIGGDTTKGSLSISICILGEALQKNVLLRSNAKLNDDIWVTGELGLAALGLKYIKKKFDAPKVLIKNAIKALEKPQPIDVDMKKLAKLFNSAIDLSDGLVPDLNHVLNKSALGADIFLESLPMPKWIRENKAYSLVLKGGDDYQLLLTAPKSSYKKIIEFSIVNQIKMSHIGAMTKTKKIAIIKSDGRLLNYKEKGYDHFAE
jgi:thiamine-monophosphate kinase